MRIGTLLKTSVSVAILMVLGLGVANWRISIHLNADLLTRERAQAIERNISNLLVLTLEYAQYSEQRALQQWQVAQNNIIENLEASAEDQVPAPKEALQVVKRLSGLVDQLDIARSSNLDIQHRQRNLLLDQLQGSSQLLADLVSHWRGSIDRRLQENEQNFRLLTLFIPVLMLLILIVLALILKWRVLQPLTQLNKAVSAVARGDMTVRSATAYKDEFGELSRTFDAMAIDLVVEMKNEIAARKQVEQELHLKEQALTSSEQFLNAIIDTEPECIKMLDIDSNLLMMNPAGLEMIEADSFEQVEGHCVCPLITPPYQEAFTTLTKQVFQGVPGKLEFEITGIKGRERWLETHAVPFRDEQGKIVAALGITRDITARKRAETENRILVHQMQHTQKLESLGVLSGGIAHDFNNILAIIVGYCGLIKADYNSCKKNVPKIEEAAERAAVLCRQMLTYAGEARLTKEPLNIWMIVDETLSMLKSTLPGSVALEAALSAKTLFILADEGQIRQVVINLITNAAEAVDEKQGKIDKNKGGIDKEQGEIKVSLVKVMVMADQPEKDYIGEAIPPGEYACLEVTDNGRGMDEETKWRIFEPFYTTKFPGRGLGMSAVLGIIKSHDGALQLFSKPGSGTTFKVYLPVVPEEIGGEENSGSKTTD